MVLSCRYHFIFRRHVHRFLSDLFDMQDDCRRSVICFYLQEKEYIFFKVCRKILGIASRDFGSSLYLPPPEQRDVVTKQTCFGPNSATPPSRGLPPLGRAQKPDAAGTTTGHMLGCKEGVNIHVCKFDKCIFVLAMTKEIAKY